MTSDHNTHQHRFMTSGTYDVIQRVRWVWLAVLILLLPGGCQNSDSSMPTETIGKLRNRPQLVVTSYPLLSLAELLVDGSADITCIDSESTSSRDGLPSPDELASLQAADAILLNGAGYEPWRQIVTLPNSRVTDTSLGYLDQIITTSHDLTHQHGPEGDQTGRTAVPTTWLDPELLAAQFRQVEDCISRLLPDQETQIVARAADVAAEFERLDQQLQTLATATEQPTTAFAGSPKSGYLTRRLEWQVHDLNWPDEPLSASQLKQLTQQIDTIQPQMLLLSHRRPDIAEITSVSSAPVVLIDFCEQKVSSASLIERMNGNLTRIAECLQSEQKRGKSDR